MEMVFYKVPPLQGVVGNKPPPGGCGLLII